MKAKKIGSFEFGFVIDEKQFRRLVDIANEQLVKELDKDDSIHQNFILHLRNGTLVETSDIEEVFSLENNGLTQILYISTLIEIKNKHRIDILLNNAKENSRYYPISYTFESMNRDWVMVTQSKIEDRLLQIKRRKLWNPLFTANNISSLVLFSVNLSFV